MAEVKFGISQISNPTPQWATLFFRWFFYVTGIATIVLDVFTEIPPDIKLLVSGIVIKANLLVHLVSKLFGVEVPNFYNQQNQKK